MALINNFVSLIAIAFLKWTTEKLREIEKNVMETDHYTLGVKPDIRH